LTAALDEAVRCGNVERMRDLLKQGANPQLVEPGNTGVSVQANELLLAARKINRLLPRRAQAGPQLDFEEALRDYDLPRARNILDNALKIYPPDLNSPPDETDADAVIKLWEESAELGVEAILDTMLALGDDKLERYRSGAGAQDSKTIMDALLTQKGEALNSILHYPLEKGIRHSALRDYLKQFPYYSSKPERQDLAELNCQVDFKDNPEQKIDCKHLAFAWLTKVRDKNGKPDYGMLKDAGQIQENIPYRIEDEFNAFLANATEVHMVENKAWGRFTADQFREIEDRMEKGKPPIKRMLVHSGSHAMAVEFRVKEQAGRKSYAQNFYDPNLTNVHKRIRFDGMHCHEAHSLDRLLDGSSAYHAYYGESETVSMAYVVPDDDNAAVAAGAGNPGRCLSSSLDGINIDASVLFHLLKGGFDGELDKIANRLLNSILQHPDQAAYFLAAKNVDNIPGFYWALQEGHVNAVTAFAGIVLQSGLDAEQQIELLSAKNDDGFPGLYIALQENKPDAVRAFVECVFRSQLSDDQKIKLLAAKEKGGVPGIWGAESGHYPNSAATAYRETIRQLFTGEQQALLEAEISGNKRRRTLAGPVIGVL